jgi:subtilisin family serine protease
MVGHGTHVAGIVDLVAPKAKIMPLRVLGRRGYGTVFNIAQAITFADSKGADVINLSLGTPDPTPLELGLNPPKLLRDKVNEAISGGAVVVAAAGNANSSVKNYPAAQDGLFAANEGLLAVTAVDFEEEKSSFANYGTWVDISAPGEHILSTYPTSRYAYWSGTSMATPFVTGQAALIHQADGSPDPAGVEEKIRRSARFAEFYKKNPSFVLCKLGAGHTDIGASLGQPGPGPNLCPTF